MSRRWSNETKRLVVVGGVVFAALALYRVRSILQPFVLALFLAYVLSPAVELLSKKGHLPRILATGLVYLSLLVPLVVLPAVLAPGLIREVNSINIDAQALATLIEDLLARYTTIEVLGYTYEIPVEVGDVSTWLQANFSMIASRSGVILFGFASGFASTILGLLLILVVSFYIVKDADRILPYLESLVPPEYRGEFAALTWKLSDTWHDFLRGQLTLSLVVGSVTGLSLWVVGLPGALPLAIIAGVLEVVPNVGPVLAMIPALIVALLEGSTRLPLSEGVFALLILGLYAVIQQLENNILVPRIIGRSLHLHSAVVLIGMVAGASIAGLLGIFLAAPTLATVRLLGRYAYDKLLDRELTWLAIPPEPEEENADETEETVLEGVRSPIETEPSQ